jgi:hypothetical protein
VSAGFEILRETDFSFVHQVLSYERLHEVRMTTTSESLNAYLSSKLSDLLRYGPTDLTSQELQGRVRDLLKQYYHFLAIAAVNFRDQRFWNYHRRRLKELGYPLDILKLVTAISTKIFDLVLNPKCTVERALRRMKKRV